MTDDDREQAAYMQQANNAFLQTLPGGSVITDEGVYPDHVTMMLTREEREANVEAGVARAEDARNNLREQPRGTVVTSEGPQAQKDGGKQ